MNSFKITFSDKNVIQTSFNGSLDEAIGYYLLNFFELEEGKMSQAVKVEQI